MNSIKYYILLILLAIKLVFFTSRRKKEEKYHWGKVVDADSLPVEGVDIEVNFTYPYEYEPNIYVTTNESGIFKFKIPLKNRNSGIVIKPKKEGYYRPYPFDLREGRGAKENENGATILYFKLYLSKISGRVTRESDNSPVDNMVVYLGEKYWSRSGTLKNLETVTDAEGRFYFEEYFEASKPGYFNYMAHGNKDDLPASEFWYI